MSRCQCLNEEVLRRACLIFLWLLKVESGNLKVVYKNLQFQKSSFMRIYIKLLSFKQSTIQTFLENFPLSTFNFQLQKFANPSFYYTIYF